MIRVLVYLVGAATLGLAAGYLFGAAATLLLLPLAFFVKLLDV